MRVNGFALNGKFEHYQPKIVREEASNYASKHSPMAKTFMGDTIIAKVVIAPSRDNIRLANIALERLGDKRRV